MESSYSKIINGVRATLPFLTILFTRWNETNIICSGSIISQNLIITAAHCFSVPFQDFHVVFKHADQPESFYEIKNVFIHPGFSVNSKKHDVAIVELFHETNVRNTLKIYNQKSCYEPLENVGNKLTIAGYGVASMSPEDFRRNHLEELYLNTGSVGIVNPEKYKRIEIDPETMLLALGKDKAPDGTLTDSCVGDSGGPLFSADKEVLVGIVSWGISCGNEDLPGVYTRVSASLDWIRQNVPEEILVPC